MRAVEYMTEDGSTVKVTSLAQGRVIEVATTTPVGETTSELFCERDEGLVGIEPQVR